jgi:hypothetical protein
MVMTSDGVSFVRETTGCNGFDANTIAFGTCLIPKYELIAAPFNLAWGTELKVKVIARNAVGNS